ncbi:MAG: hypothetical protein AB1521_00615 [Bacteroidota bacterium]
MKFAFISILFCFLVGSFLTNKSSAQDLNFILTTAKVDTYYPTYVGNGRFSVSSSQLGTQSTESYMINFYDEGKEDIPRIAALPAWNEINYFNGEKWINDADINSKEITDYKQTLNMFSGYLETAYRWNSPNRTSDIHVTTFVSRSNKNLAIIKFQLTPDFSGEVKLIFPIAEREKPERIKLALIEKIDDFGNPDEWPRFWYPGFTEVNEINAVKSNKGGRITAHVQTNGRRTKAGIASEIFFEENDFTPETIIHKTNNSASVELKFKTQAGKKYIFYKYISIIPGFEAEGNLVDKAVDNLDHSTTLGYNKIFAAHEAEWKNLWRTDIIIEGDAELQKIIRSMIFYLLCSADTNTDFGIPPMGLSSAGYYGHIFWDSDIYMLPPLLLMHPEMAKSLVKFRYKTLESAKKNAGINNYKGAMYPWESDEIGKETTPYFAYQNALKENHIVGDAAFAQWQYFSATKDTNYLRNYGAEIIRQTADFWPSRVTYNDLKDRYEIHNVVSVSESEKDVNNETYTNAVAKINLELAVKASRLLNLPVNPDWQKLSDKMYIPFDGDGEFHPLHDKSGSGEEASKFWSSVVYLLDYPLQMKMSEKTKLNDLNRAVKGLELHGAGAMMGINFLSIIAAELGSDSLLNYTLDKTLKGYLKPPFYVLSETHENKSVNFLTGAGSFLQQVIFGYTGLRITDDGVVQKYNPMLPQKINKLILKNFTLNNKKYDVIVENNKIEKIQRN